MHLLTPHGLKMHVHACDAAVLIFHMHCSLVIEEFSNALAIHIATDRMPKRIVIKHISDCKNV